MREEILVKPWKVSDLTTIPGIKLKEREGKENETLRRNHKDECEEEIYWIKSSQRPVPSAENFLNAHGYIVEQFGGIFIE